MCRKPGLMCRPCGCWVNVRPARRIHAPTASRGQPARPKWSLSFPFSDALIRDRSTPMPGTHPVDLLTCINPPCICWIRPPLYALERPCADAQPAVGAAFCNKRSIAHTRNELGTFFELGTFEGVSGNREMVNIRALRCW